MNATSFLVKLTTEVSSATVVSINSVLIFIQAVIYCNGIFFVWLTKDMTITGPNMVLTCDSLHF